MLKSKRVREKKQEKTSISRYMMAIGALIVIALSVSNNVVYWTAQAHSPNGFLKNVMFWQSGLFDYDFWSYGLVSIATDLAKPALFFVIPAFILARSYKMAAILTVCLVASVSLSLGAAWGIRAEKQADLTAIAQKALEYRMDVHNSFVDAKNRAFLNVNYVPVATLKIDLAAAKQEVSKKIWQRTSSCEDATKKSSVNSCKTVNALRKQIKHSQEIEVANAKYDVARKALNALPRVVKEVTSQSFKDFMNIAIALFIEIFSTIGIYAAFAKPQAPQTKRKTVTTSKETDWIKTMKDAAKDPQQTGIHFDKDGLLKAPYANLKDLFDVKSARGNGRNMKYKVLENA